MCLVALSFGCALAKCASADGGATGDADSAEQTVALLGLVLEGPRRQGWGVRKYDLDRIWCRRYYYYNPECRSGLNQLL